MPGKRRKINGSLEKSSNRLDVTKCSVAFAAVALCLQAPAALAQNREDFCGAGAPRGFEARAENARTGRYVNSVYGFSLDVPAQLVGYTSARGPDRGFVIELSQSPRAYLRVEAAYDAFYDIDAAGVHRRDLNSVRLHDAVLSDQGSQISLAGERGGRYLTRMQCRGESDAGIHDAVLVVRHREIYRIDLHTVPARYARDRRQLEVMIRSWRWESLR